jgi:hypothetical protein
MTNQIQSPTDAPTTAQIDVALEAIAAVRAGVAGAIIGQERVVDLTLVYWSVCRALLRRLWSRLLALLWG